ASALAARVDLPLVAGLALSERRRSADFTFFDGNLGTLREAPRLRALLDGSRPLSPTTLQIWATCPFRFFLESVLRLAPTEDPEEEWTIDAAEKGSLVHDVLQRFFLELARQGRPRGAEPYTTDDLLLLERLADERMRHTEQSGSAGHPIVWQATRHDLLADLR